MQISVFMRVCTLCAILFATIGCSSSTPPTSGLRNYVQGVYVSGSTIYAATNGGLSVSVDNGSTWKDYTTANGLGDNNVNGVFADASGNTIYAATSGGLSISTDAGKTWKNQKIGGGPIEGVCVNGSYIFAIIGVASETIGGVAISTDNVNWTVKNTTNGLGSNYVHEVFASGSNIYAATQGGLSVSVDGGNSWQNNHISITTVDGVVNNDNVLGVYVNGGLIYAATSLGVSVYDGSTWTNYPIMNGKLNLVAEGVYVSGGVIYAATSGGVAVSSGSTWMIYTTVNGLGSNSVNSIYINGNMIYAATQKGLSVYNGSTWTNYITANGF